MYGRVYRVVYTYKGYPGRHIGRLVYSSYPPGKHMGGIPPLRTLLGGI